MKIPGEMIFTGVMDYYPNVEGVVWFCRDVLPLIRRERPGATLTICGARPDPRVQALARISGVTVTGRVADVRPYMARASVAVVPLRIARGIQNKLLEAMAMGLPAVACTAAAAGVVAAPAATSSWPTIRTSSPRRLSGCSARTTCGSVPERLPGPAWKPITAGNTSFRGLTACSQP